jgi:hypothetical protein
MKIKMKKPTKKPPTLAQLEKLRAKRGIPNPPLDGNNVQKVMCASCPFGKFGEAIGSELGRENFNELQNHLTIQCLTESNQYCHKNELKGKVSNHVCRGARNVQLQYFYYLGILESLSDEAWEKAVERGK